MGNNPRATGGPMSEDDALKALAEVRQQPVEQVARTGEVVPAANAIRSRLACTR
jgi:hypothetical protein